MKNEAHAQRTPQDRRRSSVPLRILVIDDNPDDRVLALNAFKREFKSIIGTEIIDEESLARALKEPPFDLIVTDFQLHWSTGLKLLPRLKERFPACPVIMFTGSGNEEVAVGAMKSGVDDYVLKSVRRLEKLTASARILLEKEDNRKRAQLSEARLESLLARLSVGVYRCTLEGALLWANNAFLEILGFHSPDEAKTWELGAHVLDTEAFGRHQRRLIETGKVHIPELQLRRPDGREIWISLSITVSPENENTIEGIFADITERTRLAHALQEKEEASRQAEKLESIGRLAGGVAHDFNNLLTAINGYSELLLQKINGEWGIREDLFEIQKAGTRAAKITRDLLAFSRRQMFQNRVVDLNSVVRSFENVIRRVLGENIRYEAKLADSLNPIKIDAMQLENVILNFLFNARDALHRGGGFAIETENLEIEEEEYSQVWQQNFSGLRDVIRPGRYVSMTVSDTGIGMNDETLAHVFEPFFTTKPVNKGTGLGLSTVYGIVKQSNGHIFVKSVPGKGTTFRIILPVALADGEKESFIALDGTGEFGI